MIHVACISSLYRKIEYIRVVGYNADRIGNEWWSVPTARVNTGVNAELYIYIYRWMVDSAFTLLFETFVRPVNLLPSRRYANFVIPLNNVASRSSSTRVISSVVPCLPSNCHSIRLPRRDTRCIRARHSKSNFL